MIPPHLIFHLTLTLTLTLLLPLTHAAALPPQNDTCPPQPSTSSSSPPIIDLGYAQYRGIRLHDAAVDTFLGMRYAQPPLSNLRFRAPQDPSPESSIQDASKFGPICIGTGQSPSPSTSEDCLFVNVFKPSRADPTSNLPVWVYIQGGGYSSNGNANYNGTPVVQQSGHGLVFVNFNYRVGALGFLASEHVRRDGHLNAGLLDQRKLLHWVKKHIKQFGGNPNHVVIHGVSAGAGSVTHHLTAYAAKKDTQLFAAAISESPFWPTLRTVSDMEFQYRRVLANANCSSLDCLRRLDTQAFLDAAPVELFPGVNRDAPLPLWYWLPVIDGDLVTDHLYSQFQHGNFIPVPLIVSHDTDEGTYFGANASTLTEAKSFFLSNWPNLQPSQLSAISQAYSPEDLASLPDHAPYFPSTEAAYGDATFICPGNTVAASAAHHFDPRRVWNYRYNVLDPDNVASGLGVPHTFETSAIFGLGSAGQPAASYYTINAAIIPVTMHYFLSFVMKLDPNAAKYASAPHWDPWGQGTGQRLRLETNNTAMEPVPPDQRARCHLWSRLQGYTQL
ncbi:alpha/beta-hydrolase [Trichoderma citrinoviride]|uniref:Carboxylic ester hydrolase n=1 Tax=Trichoderma citrinoviride TaxID=58853 RepID=A0A2T4BBP9_9HYPO|nr:alpha/beta-hydrolase [Trichoderma citrinoviride]PTB66747.1 alpha/beta-hydrolase [Trichoderma citrinoviride]